MYSLKYWLCLVGLLSASLMIASPAGSLAEAGFDPANLDRTCKPCDDFNQFASGGWMARNPIPAAYPSWGSFNILAENNRDQLRAILEEAAKAGDPKGSNEQKIGDYYASCMDESAIEAAGLKPLAEELERIAAIKDTAGLREEVLRLQGYGVDAPFKVDSTQDFKDSTQVIGEIDQGGLGLPDRDYYTRDDEKSQQLREEYVKHVARMLELMGDDAAKAAAGAKTVMELETQLAKASLTNVQRRDPHALYHRMGVTEIKALAPAFSWDEYLTHATLAGKGDLNVATPDFFKEVGRLLTAVPLADWKTYLRWHLINAAAPRLSAKFVEEDFNFNGKTLTGTQEILPRWKRCVRATDGALGEALGQVYVQKHFPPQAKTRALEMVHNLEAALREDIQNLPWMGPQTKKQALIKLDAIVNKIGYPDKWRDYSALEVDRGPYVLNAFRADRFEFNRDLAKVGKPVDRAEWGMSPPTVNAYYNPQLNEIVFPAGILQPPFFGADADDAFNYGGMGAVIGHELTHGFDDEGSQFDAQGNLRSWWTPEDRKNFDARAECVSKQFDGYEVEKGLNENGKLVLGESIADLGGLNIAFAAYENSLQGKPRPADIEGFTPEQRFFLGWGQVWADNMRPEFARLLTNVDQHPLPRFRVRAPLSNLPSFAKAFSCQPGDAMIRPENERCAVW
jgi:predicted metalloendopeptidase